MTSPARAISASTRHNVLAARIRIVLSDLSTVSEVSTAAAHHEKVRVTHSRRESSPPAGVVLDEVGRNGPPPKGRSLYDHYKWRFEHEDDTSRLQLLCSLAERDYAEHVRGNRRPHNETTEEADKRILMMYQGVPAMEAAVLERTSEAAIRKLRRQAHRDPESGERERLTEDEEAVLSRIRAKVPVRAIRKELGHSLGYISKVANGGS